MPAAGLTQILDEVALTALPRAILHRILGGLGGPQTEAIVVLSGKNNPLHTGTLESSDPLLDIKYGWGKGLCRRIAIAPL